MYTVLRRQYKNVREGQVEVENGGRSEAKIGRCCVEAREERSQGSALRHWQGGRESVASRAWLG